MWQVKLWLKKKRGHSPTEMREELVKALLAKVPRTKSKAKQPKTAKGTLFELSIMDHHFGKLSWQPEVGENYDVKIAETRYLAAANRMLDNARLMKPGKILIPVGNDFYHVDKGDNTTTSGTRLDADGRWQKAFIAGAKCVREVINQAREIAPVEVMVVPGNHDGESVFRLGVTLDAIYEHDGRVAVNNNPTLWKATQWGVNLIGYFHGHLSGETRRKGFKNEFQDKFPKLYAATQWRELHLGHTHSEREDVWHIRTSQTWEMVVVRVISALCGTDKWHDSKGYRSPGAAEAHLFDAKHGRTGYQVVTQHSLED